MTPPRFGLVVRTAALVACAIAFPLSGRAATLEESAPPGGNYVWLPTARVAKAWLAVATGTPFDP